MAKGTKKVVSWFVEKKALIKFEDSDEAYKLSAKVIEVSDFSKYPIEKGDTVNVSIEDDEITFLRKVKDSNKQDSAPSENSEIQKLTVEAIYKGESVKFNKNVNGKKWTKVSNNIKSQGLDTVGLVANNEVEITLTEGIITAVKIIKGKESTGKSSSKSIEQKKTSYRDEDASDRRSAVMTAKDIVIALINNKEIKKPDIEIALKDLTKTCYEAMKNL